MPITMQISSKRPAELTVVERSLKEHHLTPRTVSPEMIEVDVPNEAWYEQLSGAIGFMTACKVSRVS